MGFRAHLPCTGAAPFSASRLRRLLTEIADFGRWRVDDLCRWVEERWGVSYSEAGMLRLSWSLKLSYRKTRRATRPGDVWWQRGDTPLGWRDVGHQSA